LSIQQAKWASIGPIENFVKNIELLKFLSRERVNGYLINEGNVDKMAIGVANIFF
jgi:hypothetical protein